MSGARLPDWPVRLAAVVEAARARPFDWTTHNCLSFALECVDAMTGARHRRALSAHWATVREALRGARRVDDLVEEALGIEARIAPAGAGRGDVVLLARPEGRLLGICLGRSVAGVTTQGLGFVPAGGAVQAWRV